MPLQAQCVKVRISNLIPLPLAGTPILMVLWMGYLRAGVKSGNPGGTMIFIQLLSYCSPWWNSPHSRDPQWYRSVTFTLQSLAE